jgi:hypothetical protein
LFQLLNRVNDFGRSYGGSGKQKSEAVLQVAELCLSDEPRKIKIRRMVSDQPGQGFHEASVCVRLFEDGEKQGVGAKSPMGGFVVRETWVPKSTEIFALSVVRGLPIRGEADRRK